MRFCTAHECGDMYDTDGEVCTTAQLVYEYDRVPVDDLPLCVWVDGTFTPNELSEEDK